MAASGDLIGPYRVVSLLGKGAMGEVWRARDERLDRYVALKVLPADLAGDVERRARMLREAKAAAAIKHPHVVTLFDILSADGDDILVMELVEGRTISDALRKDGRPSLEVALGWILDIVDGLAAAHARGILHRDIKAANVMITTEGVKLLDFGLAKLADDAVVAASSMRLPVIGAAASARIALDATMASEAPTAPARAEVSLAETAAAGLAGSGPDLDSYRTHAGQLLGTPLYMAPEQVEGGAPDARSEVFSVGILAHEILLGKPPYTAATMDALFTQILTEPAPPLPDVPPEVAAIVARALAKDPAARFPSMAALRDALAAERQRLFAPPARRWPLVAAAVLLVAGAAVGVYAWRASQPAPLGPGDALVARALGEYDVFYGDKALSSLRAALAAAPDHPRASAYMILFGGASDADRTQANAAARRARPRTAAGSKDRALLDAAAALVEQGPKAARAVLAASSTQDRELAFWAAELDYRAGSYAAARDEYAALLAAPATALRGRIYDHYSSVLLYVDDPAEALRVGTLYRDAFPGEADAVGVYATTLAASGRYPEAIAAAEEALRLAEGEDTFAGLGKVLALAGDRPRARAMYTLSLERAGAGRRPVRRAALAMLQWMDGELDAARATVAPCLPGPAAGSEATVRERAACVFMAGVLDPARADAAIASLEVLATTTPELRPPYGAPRALASLIRARHAFFSGACVIPVPTPGAPPAGVDERAYDVPVDFYAAYHVPFFATWQVCERAGLRAARGDAAGATALLGEVAGRAPGRVWLTGAPPAK